MKKEKKVPTKYKVLFTLLFVYAIGLFGYLFLFSKNKSITNTYFYLNSESIFKYSKETTEWSENFSLSEIKGQIFDVYDSPKHKNSYRLYYQEKNVYYYSLDNDPIKMMDDNWYAVTQDEDVKINYLESYENKEVNDDIEQILSENDLSEYLPEIIYVASFDFDEDGNKEKIYSISNAFSSEEKLYSIIFVVDNQSFSYVKKEIVDNYMDEDVQMMTTPVSQMFVVASITIKNKNYIFIQKDDMGKSNPEYEIYTYQNSNLKLVKNIKE